MLQQGHACARPCRMHIEWLYSASLGSHVCEAALCFIQYGVRAIISMLAATLGKVEAITMAISAFAGLLISHPSPIFRQGELLSRIGSYYLPGSRFSPFLDVLLFRRESFLVRQGSSAGPSSHRI